MFTLFYMSFAQNLLWPSITPTEVLELLRSIPISDRDHLTFLQNHNGGYFFNNALHLFGIAPQHGFHDLQHMNALIKEAYGKQLPGYFFAEDVFGHLFAYHKKSVLHFDLESAEFTTLAESFDQFLAMILADVDFFCGPKLIEQLDPSTVESLSAGFRLGPKMPFVLGGAFDASNVVLKPYDEYIRFNADFSRQIDGLPDGTKVKLIFK